MLSQNKGRSICEHKKDYVVFDLETTGVSSRTDGIVEISAVKVLGGEVAAEFTTLVNPEMPISPSASEVNGITDDMVKDAPTFCEVLPKFLEFIGDLPLVGHNIGGFDMRFIWRFCELYFDQDIDNDFIDTLPLARHVLPQAGKFRLTALAEHYGISPDGAHRALNDCRMNQKVYECLCEEMKHQVKQPAIKKCPRCGEMLLRRKGKYGEFWGCSSFPACRYTENV